MSDIDFSTFCGNILFIIQEGFERIIKTIIQCAATFLIWFITVLAIGTAMLSVIKLSGTEKILISKLEGKP